MRHPDLPDSPPIEVADSAAPQHRAGGWEVTDPPPKPKGEAGGGQPQRAMTVRMSHPDVADDITVAQSAVPFHTASGWSVIEDKAKSEQAAGDKPDGEKTKGERPRASAAKKKEQG
jgi:hypothetical protein